MHNGNAFFKQSCVPKRHTQNEFTGKSRVVNEVQVGKMSLPNSLRKTPKLVCILEGERSELINLWKTLSAW